MWTLVWGACLPTMGIVRYVLKHDGCEAEVMGDVIENSCDITEKAYAVGADEGELSGRDCV